MQLNYYSSVTQPTVISSITITEWFNLIQSSPYEETIAQARLGLLPYDQTKLSLPCVTYNFRYKDYKNDSNIEGPTGLIYIDVDNPEFNIAILDKSKIYAYYHSFGGRGYSIIVRVDGITTANFKPTYLSICKDLELLPFIDFNAIKHSQFNILSSDKNIYINPNPFTYTATTTDTPQSIVIQKKKRTYTIDGGEYQSIRFNNLDELDIEGVYIVNWEGIQWVNCFIPFNRVTINRNRFLLSYTNNLVWLNLHACRERVFNIIKNVNRVACSPPVDDNHINRVINSIFKYKEEGTLEPIYFYRPRKIVFKQGVDMNKEEKLSVVRYLLAKRCIELSHKKITAILEDWDFEQLGNISQTTMYKNHPISKKTVEKYWSDFKEYVAALNKEFGG